MSRTDYIYYLMSLILPPREVGPGSPALFLFRTLDEIPFEAVCAMDQNRMMDAIRIREGYGAGEELGPVTLLEIVVELCLYLADARENMMARPEASRWFRELMRNAGIDERSSREEILEAGERIVKREYGRDGYGGLFPLMDGLGERDVYDSRELDGRDGRGVNGVNCVNGGTDDAREMELWMQLNRYLVQRYHA